MDNNDVVSVQDDGFFLSRTGPQDIRFFRLPIVTSEEDEIETPVEIKTVEGINAS